MTEGSIASWKVKEGMEYSLHGLGLRLASRFPRTFKAYGLTILSTGGSFSAGDVLLEVETDKAQMDVEAQDDGVMAKITVCTHSGQMTRHGDQTDRAGYIARRRLEGN